MCSAPQRSHRPVRGKRGEARAQPEAGHGLQPDAQRSVRVLGVEHDEVLPCQSVCLSVGLTVLFNRPLPDVTEQYSLETDRHLR